MHRLLAVIPFFLQFCRLIGILNRIVLSYGQKSKVLHEQYPHLKLTLESKLKQKNIMS